MVANQKIQIEDQHLNEQGNPEGMHITRTIYMLQYSMSNTVSNQSFFTLKHGYEYFQHMQTIVFLNSRKHYELFAKTLLGTAASHWVQMTQEFIDCATFQGILDYFKWCLQEWVKLYFSCDSHRKHFVFMQTKGALKRLKTCQSMNMHSGRPFISIMRSVTSYGLIHNNWWRNFLKPRCSYVSSMASQKLGNNNLWNLLMCPNLIKWC